MVYRFKNISIALWQYLNQPLFCHDAQQSVWKPSRFWYLYKIKFLEACLRKEFVTQAHNPFGHDEFRAGN
ncbi:hypothetical protein IQ215_02975 [Cyanobacterium stanieri LEGE 03274]|uniref:Uncharacterized protein n=1 Tax=Cyanobacterium stanieri LEGE 03274 TaxID=1828756 RepID=A0ABR9V181_9CHRO|nr:hypothetical protein [Cyanobacterium stanieri]MBE9221650.1 hypothetical protein [Cyanobacterium stanieri LEGE 03274]